MLHQLHYDGHITGRSDVSFNCALSQYGKLGVVYRQHTGKGEELYEQTVKVLDGEC